MTTSRGAESLRPAKVTMRIHMRQTLHANLFVSQASSSHPYAWCWREYWLALKQMSAWVFTLLTGLQTPALAHHRI